MAKAAKGTYVHEPVVKKTSQSRRASDCKTSSMNKSKKRSLKMYRGQGR